MPEDVILNGVMVYAVQPPDAVREVLIPLDPDGMKQLGPRLGAVPSKASVARWRMTGFPVERNGPRVRLPCLMRMKRVYTSTPALTRWLEMIQKLSEEIQGAGGAAAWHKAKAEEKAKHVKIPR